MGYPEIFDRDTDTQDTERLHDESQICLSDFKSDYQQLSTMIQSYSLTSSSTPQRWEMFFRQVQREVPELTKRYHIRSAEDLRIFHHVEKRKLDSDPSARVEAVFKEWSFHPMHANRLFRHQAISALMGLPNAYSKGYAILMQAAECDPWEAIRAFSSYMKYNRTAALEILQHAATILLTKTREPDTFEKLYKDLCGTLQYWPDNDLLKTVDFVLPHDALIVIKLCYQNAQEQRNQQNLIIKSAEKGREWLTSDDEEAKKARNALENFAAIDSTFLKFIGNSAQDTKNIDRKKYQWYWNNNQPEALFRKLIMDPAIAINFHTIYQNCETWVKQSLPHSMRTDDIVIRMCVLVSRILASRQRFHSDENPLTQREVEIEIINWKTMMTTYGREEILNGNIVLLCDNQFHANFDGYSYQALQAKTSDISMKYMWHTPVLFQKIRQYAKGKEKSFEYYIPTPTQTEEQIKEACCSLIINTQPPLVLGILSHGDKNSFIIDYYRKFTISAELLATAFAARYRKYGQSTKMDRIIHFHCYPYDMVQNFNFYRTSLIPGHTGHPWQLGASEFGQTPFPASDKRYDDIERIGMDRTWALLLDPETGIGRTVQDFVYADLARKGIVTNPFFLIPHYDAKRNDVTTPFPLSDHQRPKKKNGKIG